MKRMARGWRRVVVLAVPASVLPLRLLPLLRRLLLLRRQ